MFNMKFDYLINEYMVYCRSRQLREQGVLTEEEYEKLKGKTLA